MAERPLIVSLVIAALLITVASVAERSGGLPLAREVVRRSCNRSHWTGTTSTSMSSCSALNASCNSARYSSVRPSCNAQKKVVIGARWLLEFMALDAVEEVTRYVSAETIDNIAAGAMEAKIGAP